MADVIALNINKIGSSNGTKNDVVPMQQIIMETAEIEIPSTTVANSGVGEGGNGGGGGGGVKDVYCADENNLFVCNGSNGSGENNVNKSEAQNLNNAPQTILNNNNNNNSNNNNNNNNINNNVNGKFKNKRRRRKSKQKLNKTKPYKKTAWKFQVPRQQQNQQNQQHEKNGLSTLVPYNTNKFLMEEHMPELPSAGLSPNGRTRESSFSVDDSEDNGYFNALPEDEEEFLTKEFSSVYEDARSERLDGMSKTQLIREYLQMEANYDKLSKNLGDRKSNDDNAKEIQLARNFERENNIQTLEERVKELTEENLGELRVN